MNKTPSFQTSMGTQTPLNSQNPQDKMEEQALNDFVLLIKVGVFSLLKTAPIRPANTACPAQVRKPSEQQAPP